MSDFTGCIAIQRVALLDVSNHFGKAHCQECLPFHLKLVGMMDAHKLDLLDQDLFEKDVARSFPQEPAPCQHFSAYSTVFVSILITKKRLSVNWFLVKSTTVKYFVFLRCHADFSVLYAFIAQGFFFFFEML